MEIQDGKHQMSFVFFTTQAYDEIVKLHIVYTRESERARLRYTFERRDFYLSKNHPVNMPDTITLSNLKLEDALTKSSQTMLLLLQKSKYKPAGMNMCIL